MARLANHHKIRVQALRMRNLRSSSPTALHNTNGTVLQLPMTQITNGTVAQSLMRRNTVYNSKAALHNTNGTILQLLMTQITSGTVLQSLMRIGWPLVLMVLMVEGVSPEVSPSVANPVARPSGRRGINGTVAAGRWVLMAEGASLEVNHHKSSVQVLRTKNLMMQITNSTVSQSFMRIG